MTETNNRVKEGKEYRQNIIDKTSVESTTAYTYETNDEKNCDTAVKEAKEENQKKIDEES